MLELVFVAAFVFKLFDAAEVNSAIDAAADRNGVPRELAHAVAIVESGKNPWKMRLEEDWFERCIKNKKKEELAGWTPFLPVGEHPSLYDEKTWRATSFGVMQVMGDRARILGLDCPWLAVLLSPTVGAEYGCRFLKQLLVRYNNDIQKVALGYNGGGDPNYPRKIFEAIQVYRATQQRGT